MAVMIDVRMGLLAWMDATPDMGCRFATGDSERDRPVDERQRHHPAARARKKASGAIRIPFAIDLRERKILIPVFFLAPDQTAHVLARVGNNRRAGDTVS
jgi:hypothetical protein